MTSPPASADASQSVGPPKRRFRNYLLNPRFQLKYSALLCGVAMVLMAALGTVIWRIANVAADQARTAVAQSLAAANQAERAMHESQTTSTVVRMEQLSRAADNPDLVQTIEHELQEIEQQGRRNLREVQDQRHAISAQRANIERNRIRTLYTLIVAGLLLILLLFITGVVITHKVVGPVFKMKRLLRQVGTGKLDIRERLRKGDELEDLFDTFLKMTESLKEYQRGEMAKLDAAIIDAESQSAPASVIEKMRALRADMAVALGSPDSIAPYSD